jgi:PII-like signaling protein
VVGALGDLVRFDAEQVLCRFYLTSRQRHGEESLYQWIVQTAHRESMQGATVLKGILGLRRDGALLEASPWAFTRALPVIIEVIDGPRHIEALLARVEPVLREGTITLERAHVLLYRGASRPDSSVHAVDVARSQNASAAWGVKTMNLSEQGVLLRIFVGEGDRAPTGAEPLYRALVTRARAAHLAGATVLKGPLGFGKHSRLHAANLLDLSTDLPVVVEIVDSEEKIQGFLPVVDELVSEGLVTLEAVRVLKYAAHEDDLVTPRGA